MQVLTKQQVLRRIEKFCHPYANYKAAAAAMGCTQAQLSEARLDRQPPCPAILKAIGVARETFYAVDVDNKYRDGSMSL